MGLGLGLGQVLHGMKGVSVKYRQRTARSAVALRRAVASSSASSTQVAWLGLGVG